MTRTQSSNDKLDVLAGPERREAVLLSLMRRIMRKEPDLYVSQIAAEMLRATVGQGDYAMPQPKSIYPPGSVKPKKRKT
jgi:hypothetical protein